MDTQEKKAHVDDLPELPAGTVFKRTLTETVSMLVPGNNHTIGGELMRLGWHVTDGWHMGEFTHIRAHRDLPLLGRVDVFSSEKADGQI
jgi:hypothetical protein